jgi:hypothetical protein
MSGGSKKENSQAQQTVVNQTDPKLMGLLTSNYDTAKTNAGVLGAPFTGQLTAGFNPTQIQAQGILSGIGTDPLYANNANSAIDAAKGVLGVDPGTIAGTDLSPYLNPYTQNVIDTTIADQERARQIANVGNAQKATAAGAFGGSRSAVLDSLTNDAYDRNTGSLIAGLHQANFSNAQQAAQNDVNNRINGANLKLNVAGDMANLNNNALGVATTQAGLLGGVGDAQQQQEQSGLDRIYQDWLTGKQLTVQQQQMLNSALGLIPNQGTTTSNSSGSSVTKEDPGLAGILGGLGSFAMGLGKNGLGLSLSDGRAKEDVETLVHDDKGRRWVTFRYKGEPTGKRRVGVIAQEVRRTDPHAVVERDDGMLLVDYGKLQDAA